MTFVNFTNVRAPEIHNAPKLDVFGFRFVVLDNFNVNTKLNVE